MYDDTYEEVYGAGTVYGAETYGAAYGATYGAAYGAAYGATYGAAYGAAYGAYGEVTSGAYRPRLLRSAASTADSVAAAGLASSAAAAAAKHTARASRAKDTYDKEKKKKKRNINIIREIQSGPPAKNQRRRRVGKIMVSRDMDTSIFTTLYDRYMHNQIREIRFERPDRNITRSKKREK